MNDIAGHGNSPGQPFEQEFEGGEDAGRDFLNHALVKILKHLDKSDSDETAMLKAILEDAYYVLPSSAAVDVGCVLRLCLRVFCESPNNDLAEPDRRFSAGKKFRIQNVQFVLRPRFDFLRSVFEHIRCCLDAPSGSGWNDIAIDEPSEDTITIHLRTRDQKLPPRAADDQPTIRWTLTTVTPGDHS